MSAEPFADEPATKISVMIADDHTLVRQGIATLLQTFTDFVLVGTAASGDEAVKIFEEKRPDVVLLDLMMPELSGVDVIPLLCEIEPEVKVIVLTSFDDKPLMQAAIKQGVAGYFLKHISGEALADGIRRVHAGEVILGPSATQIMLAAINSPPQSTSFDLSQRELEVLALLTDGLTNAEIAHQLKLKLSTVKTYVGRILSKLNASSRVEAATIALKYRLVDM